MKKILFVFIAGLVFFSCATGGVVPKEEVLISPDDLIKVGDQSLFLSGMNLAWMEFAQDLKTFDEARWQNALDQLAHSGANTVRWWIHTNGSSSPEFNGDEVVGIPEESLANFKRALDLAWQKGILVVPCLWSFDMLQPQNGVDQERNKRLLEEDDFLQTYIDNALIPMVRYVGHHPALAAWEIFNEPEGMTSYGWTPVRTDMATVQKVVNRLAGAIHREDSKALVSNGSWSFKVLTDVDGMTNYYRDDRLVEAGGDPDGTLDFYMVHYYPRYWGNAMSPFHHPASYWELDKPLVIGEFPAKGIVDSGEGFAPSSELSSEEAYLYAMENGYAGCLSWTFTAHDGFGGIEEAFPGILGLRRNYPDYIKLDQSDMDELPKVVLNMETLIIRPETEIASPYCDLRDVFLDKEDGTDLIYSVESSQSSVVQAQLDGNLLRLIAGEISGVSQITLGAEDHYGNLQKLNFLVYQINPEGGNLALLKEVQASSEEKADNAAFKAVDGLLDTRWSSLYQDGELLTIDLDGLYLVDRINLYWEAAYGKDYQIESSLDGEEWELQASITDGDGELDEILMNPSAQASYIRINCLKRATEWGFSLWECEVVGSLVE